MTEAAPDRTIVLKSPTRRWRAAVGGHLIADSDRALIAEEPGRAPVVYFPQEDVETEVLSRTSRTSHCPLKGDAVWYSIARDGDVFENAVWSYEEPLPGVAQIAGRLAFDTAQVEVYAVDDASVNPRHVDAATVDEVVLHTDSGAGRSQRETWPPNVDGPPSSERRPGTS